MVSYDVITVGGGIGGASLALSMAQAGHRVVVLEREAQFKDRVRGEVMYPWGVGEAKKLGIHELLSSACGHDLPFFDFSLAGNAMPRRDLRATTPQGAAALSFYHPEMQESLIRAAEETGAEVRRCAKVVDVHAGTPARVVVQPGSEPGDVEEIEARLVVGADGRGSLTRKRTGFEVKCDPPGQAIAGLLLDDCGAPDDVSDVVMNPTLGRGAVVFPQGGGRARTYLIYSSATPSRLHGDADIPRYIEESIETGISGEHFRGAKPAGPLASFECADTWTDHPYKSGIALVGDAAAANDPSLGEGLSLTLRDVRVLRDHLLANDDWEAAGHAYAREHDWHYGVIHDVIRWLCTLILHQGPQADALRARALPRIAMDLTRIPDHQFSGPDLPFDDSVRKRLFGED